MSETAEGPKFTKPQKAFAIAIAVVLGAGALYAMGSGVLLGSSDPIESRESVDPQAVEYERVCTWIEDGTDPASQIEEKIDQGDEAEVAAAVAAKCPELEGYIAVARERIAFYEDDPSDTEGTESAAPQPDAEAPTYDEMHPVALDNCVAYMVGEGIATREDAARQQCDASMDPTDADTHWIIDQYYTNGG